MASSVQVPEQPVDNNISDQQSIPDEEMPTLDETSNPPPPSEERETITLTIKHQSTTHTFTLPTTSQISDLSEAITSTLQIPPENQKLLISPKPGLLKPPFDPSSTSGSIPLSTLSSSKTKITLLGSTPSQIATLDAAISQSQHQLNRYGPSGRGNGVLKTATPSRSKNWKSLSDSITYTFGSIKPLPYLPNPQKSQRYLERLAEDPGIKSVMAAHKWSVGLLTEMDPAQHTTHESRTLGLNRNAGEVIELRLRTDAYDGYRDYKTIRKTLCHELTHNVLGEHDARFWKLCREVEKEVEKGDWKSSGHAVGAEEFYNPNDPGVSDGDFVDGGGWTGGTFVLGSGSGGGSGGTAASGVGTSAGTTPAERREAVARAAEERARKAREEEGRR